MSAKYMSNMDYSYTYSPAEIAHTLAKAGDTGRWTQLLSGLADPVRCLMLNQRELLQMDNSILDIEMKKALVPKNELLVSR